MENNDSIQLNSKRVCASIDLANLSVDPWLRRKIHDYHPNDHKDQIQRIYI